MSILTTNIEQLNSAQQSAVTANLGNLLVLAGAGSGKTKVLVNRVAWLIKQYNVDPYNIMVVTFTNKAAKEMNNRLSKMQLSNISSSWIGTFHSLSHKLLKIHATAAGLNNNFEVIDSEDQLKIIRHLVKQLNIESDLFEPKKVQHFINRQKDQGFRSKNLPSIRTRYDKIMFEIYAHYENSCNSQNVVDFAELLLRSYELLKNNQELLQHYRGRFKHVLIDEFQDTNPIQYDFLKLLGLQADSITAVGDDDQSIYGWRGAKVENIAKYIKEFVGTNIIRLEKNYRSTKTILSAANAIINNNFDRLGKTLWTDSPTGDSIVLYAALHEEDEALFIVKEIQELVKNNKKYSDIAVLYRSNSQSRAIEEALVKVSIPYVVYGGVNFFERAEIKDVLAYLRLAINSEDNAAFERVINTPVRGIGERSLEKIRSFSAEHNINYLAASKRLIALGDFSGATYNGLTNFINIINSIAENLQQAQYTLTELLKKTIELSGLLDYLQKQRDPSSVNRIENLQELINATTVFNTISLENSNNIDQIKEFLAYAAMEGKEYVSQEKNTNNNTSGNVQLMTLHSAKGLEFPIVFLCGLEEGLFPHYFSKDNPDSLNEERRLCYVGITRSMEKIFISYAQKRRLFGREELRIRSRFISEIPISLIEERKRQIFVANRKNYITSKLLTKKPITTTQQVCGKKIKHYKFGVGLIIDQDGNGDKARIHVDFGKQGTKWLMLDYAKLEVLN